MIQLAWRFLMFQERGALALWYHARTADSRIATRKTMIVALARKLIIALWRFLTTGAIGGRHLTSSVLKGRSIGLSTIRRSLESRGLMVASGTAGIGVRREKAALGKTVDAAFTGFCELANATSSLPPAPRASSRVMLHPVEKF
jgi:hypothetical protein